MTESPSINSLQHLLVTNLVISVLLVFSILFLMSLWFWTRIQNIRTELRKEAEVGNNSIFPTYPQKPIYRNEKIPTPSDSPSSITSVDFASKTLLDKKVFALSGSGSMNKSPSSGLKDLI